jgi:hypothetical protein
VKIIPAGVNPQMTQAMLSFYRAAYDAGHRVVDPETPDYILPTTEEDFRSQVARLRAQKQ